MSWWNVELATPRFMHRRAKVEFVTGNDSGDNVSKSDEGG